MVLSWFWWSLNVDILAINPVIEVISKKFAVQFSMVSIKTSMQLFKHILAVDVLSELIISAGMHINFTKEANLQRD